VEGLASHVECLQELPKVDAAGRVRVAAVVGQVRMVVAGAEELKGVKGEEAHYCVCRDSGTHTAVSIR
jgi:hypothetical protein